MGKGMRVGSISRVQGAAFQLPSPSSVCTATANCTNSMAVFEHLKNFKSYPPFGALGGQIAILNQGNVALSIAHALEPGSNE